MEGHALHVQKMLNQKPEDSAPKLYNWVRAIKKISFISAIYTAIITISSLLLFIVYSVSAPSNSPPYSLLASLVSTILLTIGVRNILLQKIIKKFNSNFNYELLLASWCILLILLHLQCQLLNLMLFNFSVSPYLAYSIFIFTSLVLCFTWPRLKSIQSLLQEINP